MFFYDNRFELLLKFKERNENIILKLLKLYYDFFYSQIGLFNVVSGDIY